MRFRIYDNVYNRLTQDEVAITCGALPAVLNAFPR